MGRPWVTDKRVCSNCGSDKTGMKKDRYPNWFRYNDGYICESCYGKLIHNPSRSKESIQKYNARNNHKMINFKGKRILLKDDPRKGICSWCGAVRGKDCKITNLHHIEYHDDDILKDTVELCASCHAKESERIKKESIGRIQ
jgi:hypothetical protein